MRIVHYLNQFFAGVGGEEAADTPVQVRAGALGPGRLLEQALGDAGRVVTTVICGDNYANDHSAEALPAIEAALRESGADVLVAGPAFSAGRYGVACVEAAGRAVAIGLPAVTAMHPDNPGVPLAGDDVYVVPTAAGPSGMGAAIRDLVRLAQRLAAGTPLGPAEAEGYLPHGLRMPGEREEPGYRRAVEMLMRKLRGEPFVSEVPYQAPEQVAPAPPVADVSRTVLALVTTGGLIPKGNPEGQTSGNAHWYGRYDVGHLQSLTPDDWEAYHSGYFTHLSRQNPNYILPLSYARELVAAGELGGVHPYAYALPGVSTPVSQAQELGRGIAEDLRRGEVGACLLVST